MSKRRGRRKNPFKLKLKKDIVYSIVSVFFGTLSLVTLLSFTRQGALLATVFSILNRAFGWTMFVVPFLFLCISLMMTSLKWALAALTPAWWDSFLGVLGISRAGTLGETILSPLQSFSPTLGLLSSTAVMLIGVMVLTNTPLEDFLLWVAGGFTAIKNVLSSRKTKESKAIQPKLFGADNLKTKINIPESTPTPLLKHEVTPDFESQIKNTAGKDGTTKIWKYPPLSLLSPSNGSKADRGDIKENAAIIESTLDSFGIRAKVAEVNGGPAITQYAIKIAEGTKLSKIKALQTDLALRLAAPTGQIRIEAPIPGRNLVGIEIPNKSPEYVTLYEILNHPDMKKEKSRLAVGLGLGVSGLPEIADIKKMPHILVAGSTGSGKSVCINTIITTLLFRNSPQELRFIMIDPKRVELTGYNGIPHLLTPVIVDTDRVIAALQWATKEMEKRYKMFAEVGSRNIEDYNEQSGFTAMDYIVIVIDELADIMLTAPSKVEDLVVRLAQMARATGIHLVIATQRPSVNVITGLIKANIPTRIAFNVASMIDSRVIIDSPGA